ncbi:MAG: LamG domain-containing protein [Bacteroidota bacterium]
MRDIYLSELSSISGRLTGSYALDGNILDDSADRQHGTNFGGALGTDRTASEAAITFDGNGYAQVTASTWIAEDYTFAAWFKTSELPPVHRYLLSKHSGASAVGDGDNHVALSLGPDGMLHGWLTTEAGASVAGQPTAGPVALDTWHHVALVRENGLQTLYLDGVASHDTYQDDLGLFSMYDGFLHIGAPNYLNGGWDAGDRANQKWVGAIDDVHIYNRALDAGEVLGLAERSYVAVQSRVFLEGAYAEAEGAMRTDLQAQGVLPLGQPFSQAPWSYMGTEAVTEAFLADNTDIVDWVLLEVRANESDTSTVARQAALLRSDGSITSVSASVGAHALQLVDVPMGEYYVVIHHRNHLPIMSANPVAFTGSRPSAVDFSSAMNRAYGTQPLVQLGPSLYGMLTGDANGNGQVQNDDKNEVWQQQVGTAGYLRADFNLNGQVQNDDKNEYWQQNVGRGTQIDP